MRSLLLFTGLLCCFALTPIPPTLAQTPPTPAGPKVVDILTVVVPEAEVRSGPSDKYYVTTKLHPGDKVEVVGQSDASNPGWLAIRPPEGSFSWINGTYVHEVTPDHKTGIVAAMEETQVPVYAGSSVLDKEPNVESDKVKRGTILTIIGSANFSNGGKKVPILPTPRELRYIRADQVKKVDFPPGVTPGSKSQDANSKISLAEQKVRDARSHLLDAYTAATDPAQRQDIQNKLAMLPNVPGGASIPGPTSPGYPNPNANNPLYHQTAAQPSDTKVINASAAISPAQWSAWGTLRKANFNSKDGLPMYVLLGQQGDPLLYAVAVTGKSLESQVGRFVSLYGTSTYQGDPIRMNVVTVSHVSNP